MTRPSDDTENEDTSSGGEQLDAVPDEDAKPGFSGLSEEAKERLATAFADSGLAERFGDLVPKMDMTPLLRSSAIGWMLKSFSDHVPKSELPVLDAWSSRIRD